MTLENATQNLWKAHCNFYDPRKAMNIVIDQIYNDHETAIEILMKANEEEISRHFNELKAKDEITQDIKEAYELKSIAYDLLLEAIKLKDEEIERLKTELDNMCNGYNDPMAWNSVKDDDDVFDTFDSEEQLKAKENDLEHQDMIIKCLSMDLDNKEKLLKAKDEEIEGLKAELHYEETAVRSIKDL